MGIYDRDYIRDRRPTPGAYGRAGIAPVRMWSVNTWLIVACVAVFVVDALLPPVLVQGRDFLPSDLGGRRPRTAVAVGDPRVADVNITDAEGNEHTVKAYVRPLLGRPGGVQIGWVEVTPMHPLTAALHFSTARGFLRLEIWRFVGFQFLHGGVWHLLFNMLGLYIFGPMAERYLGPKRYLAFYLLCGICGAVMYLLLNLGGYIVEERYGTDVVVPGLIFNSPFTPLVGASAGVFGVLMAGAYLAPRDELLLWGLLPIRQDMLAYVLVAGALVTVIFGGQNAGGEAGHLGGAIAGFYLIRRPRHLHGFFDFLGWADPTSHHYRGGIRRPRTTPGRPEEVDRILDKISNTGLHSLTDREKQVLRDASDARR